MSEGFRRPPTQSLLAGGRPSEGFRHSPTNTVHLDNHYNKYHHHNITKNNNNNLNNLKGVKVEVLTLGGGSRDWQILDNYTKPKLHRSCQTFSQYLHFGFKYTVFFSLVLRLLSHLTFLNFYHSLNPLSTKTSNLSLNYMNFSTVSDR